VIVLGPTGTDVAGATEAKVLVEADYGCTVTFSNRTAGIGRGIVYYESIRLWQPPCKCIDARSNASL